VITLARHFMLTSGKRSTAIPMRIFENPSSLRAFSSPLGWRILKELSEPACPIDIAKKLGVHEQKVYYHIRKFRDARLISEVRREPRKGTIARFYQLRDHAFGISLPDIPGEKEIAIPPLGNFRLLEPFVRRNLMNSRIIVGSPDPHGPWKARASDSCCAIDFALFLGAFTSGPASPNYKLDTEVRDSDLRGNLILIGGPTANMITGRANDRLPVRFDLEGKVRIHSELSKKSYPEEEHGLVAIVQNPWDRKSRVMVLAGNRFQGTRAAILACIQSMEKIMEGNRFSKETKARVVKGFDVDGDGIIDSADILE
jgi:DNA-binding transcriptional ArsR family regulator